jgi:hypothetical protein
VDLDLSFGTFPAGSIRQTRKALGLCWKCTGEFFNCRVAFVVDHRRFGRLRHVDRPIPSARCRFVGVDARLWRVDVPDELGQRDGQGR